MWRSGGWSFLCSPQLAFEPTEFLSAGITGVHPHAWLQQLLFYLVLPMVDFFFFCPKALSRIEKGQEFPLMCYTMANRFLWEEDEGVIVTKRETHTQKVEKKVPLRKQ